MHNLLKIKSVNKMTLVTMFLVILGFSCQDKTSSYLEEMAILKKYIADNNITTEPTASGLYYIETLAGTGERARTGMTVSVYYKGYLLDGTVFDQNLDYETPFTFTLGYSNVIQGWHEGISYMKDGGKATLIIPSSLGYSYNSSGLIPAYSTLIFEVELVNVQ